MEQCWRWFGPGDPISLAKIAQAGATGIVNALHEIPTGEVWPVSAIMDRNSVIEDAGLKWSVVESVPVHADIQKGNADRDQKIDAYKQTIRNLAEVGVGVICYNFMPIVDWTRTELGFVLQNGAEALRFDAAQFAAYDVHILKRRDATLDYDDDMLRRAEKIYSVLDEDGCTVLEKSIIAGLPGGEGSYGREGLRSEIEIFRELGESGLRQNLEMFLSEIVPVAAESGVAMAIHPDDPPFSLFGVPRIVSTADDVRKIFSIENSIANGLTLCAGSFGARGDNDLTQMATEFGERIHFVHLRNVTREHDGSFYESEHLDGDNDLISLVSALLQQESVRSQAGGAVSEIPMRPDHGHTMGDELEHCGVNPGYSYVGRLKGLAELRGVIRTLEWQERGASR
ncbi:MAG: mannonate dehydratase [Woeseiaceae bacterium]|nr:mannonate dehydratase [Woeseiaceae bacterium]